jgi:methionyl-tRNA formyltransferase
VLNKLILLTGEIEAPHLTPMLRLHAPTLEIVWAADAQALAAAVKDGLAGVRLVAVMSGVIVPADVLSNMDGPAYNFHPGPPEYPGSRAAGFAIYEGATSFGVTLHEMAAKVDSGPIVDVMGFDVPPGAKPQDLEVLAYLAVIQMFADYAPKLACDPSPLPQADIAWSGPVRTHGEAARLAEITSVLSEDEIGRRSRAFG